MRRWVGWAVFALMHAFLAGQAVAQSRASPFYGEAAGAEQQALLEGLRTAQMAERMAGVVNVTLALRKVAGPLRPARRPAEGAAGHRRPAA